jgi:hypothetical protein
MKVTFTLDARQHLLNQLGDEPTIKLHEIRTTG